MPPAVASSVSTVVRMTPTRPASTPHANLPTAPPAKVSARARPTDSTAAPLAMRRNGRKVRKPVRVPPSMTPMAESAWKPRRSRMPQREPPRPAGAAADAGGPLFSAGAKRPSSRKRAGAARSASTA